MTLVPVRGADGAAYQLEGDTGPGGGFVQYRADAPMARTGKGGTTSSATGTAANVAATNTSRKVIEVSNGGASGVWLAFGEAAVAGQGTYLPAKATGYWRTTQSVACILEASGTGGAVGYTEWA